MTTGQDQTRTLHDAADRARAGVTDPRFGREVDAALEDFGPALASHVGRYDSGELFVPLEVWLGKWEPGAALVLQDRAVIVWGGTELKTQFVARERPGGVAEVDVQPDAVTLWIDCEEPRNVRVKRYDGATDVPARFADLLRPHAGDREPAAALPPALEQCPHCFAQVAKGAEFCPSCGRHLGAKPARSKKPLVIALLVLVLLAAIVTPALLLRNDDAVPPGATSTPTASAEPGADPFRRISGPGWEGRAPRALRIGGVDRQSGGRLLVRTLRGEGGLVIRIFHTPEEPANPGTFRVGSLKPLETGAAESFLATVENFGTPECRGRRCSDLLLNDPAWGGIAITVNATSGARLDAAKSIAASIKAR